MKFLILLSIAVSTFANAQTDTQLVARETLVVSMYKMLNIKTVYRGENGCTYSGQSAICGFYNFRLQPYSVSVEYNLRKIANKYGAGMVAVRGKSNMFQLMFFRRFGKMQLSDTNEDGFLSGMPENEYKVWLDRMVSCSQAIEDEYTTGIDNTENEKTGATLFTLKPYADSTKCFNMFEALAKRVSELTGKKVEATLVTDYLVRLGEIE